MGTKTCGNHEATSFIAALTTYIIQNMVSESESNQVTYQEMDIAGRRGWKALVYCLAYELRCC